MAVTDVAITKIKDMISSGEVKPGDRLPVEKKLAAELGLSRNSLREAVRALSLLGILDVRQGDGTYVSELKPATILDGIGFFLEVGSDSRMLEAIDARRMLEPGITAAAALRMEKVEFAELTVAMNAMEEAESAEELIQADVQFHRIVADGTGNSMAATFVNGLGQATVRGRVWRLVQEESSVETVIAEHQAILGALTEHDPVLAESAASVHVASVDRWLRRALNLEVGPHVKPSDLAERLPVEENE